MSKSVSIRITIKRINPIEVKNDIKRMQKYICIKIIYMFTALQAKNVNIY